jgi:hypothetical protein
MDGVGRFGRVTSLSRGMARSADALALLAGAARQVEGIMARRGWQGSWLLA